jgi:uncharacterized membrane protein YqjE
MPRDGPPLEAWEGFTPLRPATRAKRIAMFVVGPLAWIVTLVIVARIVEDDNVVELGLLIALVSFLVAFALLTLAHLMHRRREAAR